MSYPTKSGLATLTEPTPMQAINNSSHRSVARDYILAHQNAATGLFPSRLILTAEDEEQPEHDGWVVENVFTIISIWALAMAFRKIDNDKGRRYELEQASAKCFRGLLTCMMREANKAEELKRTQSINDAFHTKYDLRDFSAVSDVDGVRLSIYSISLFIFYLTQMTQSGLQIVFTMDEVCFVQNLVYCIERAYRTPDFCIWTRTLSGHNPDKVRPELKASSIGMAKAALEAIGGVNILGPHLQSSGGFIHVDPDALNRNRAIFSSMLPRESSTTENDVMLLLALGFPAFSCHDPGLVSETESGVYTALKGRYGFKRFNGDITEEGRNCEFPVFLAFSVITEYMLTGSGMDPGTLNKNRVLLDSLLVEHKDGFKLVPELYHYNPHYESFSSRSSTTPHTPYATQPPEVVSRRRTFSQSHPVIPNSMFFTTAYPVAASHSSEKHHRTPPSHHHMQHNNKFLLWHQSIYFIATMFENSILEVKDIDPMGRGSWLTHKDVTGGHGGMLNSDVRRARRKSDIVVQVALLAENEKLQMVLGTYGISTQNPQQIEPITMWAPSTLVDLYSHLGINSNFNLSGRPNRPCGSLSTSKVYMLRAQTFVFYPLILEHTDFYMSLDLLLLIDKIKDELKFLQDNWSMNTRPLVCLLITESMVTGENFTEMLDLMASLKQGDCNGVPIKLGRLQQLVLTSCMEHLEFLSEPAFESIFNSDATANEKLALPRLMPDRRDSQAESSLSVKRIATPNDTTVSNDNDLDTQAYIQAEQECWDNRTIGEIVEILRVSDDLVQQASILTHLSKRMGLNFDTSIGKNGTVGSLLDEIYHTAGSMKLWSVIRQVSGVKEKVADSLAPALTEMLIRDVQVSICTYGGPEFVITEPLTPKQITDAIFSYLKDPREAVLAQELLLYLSHFVVAESELFENILRLRIGNVLEAMKSELAIQYNLRSKAAATAKLMSMQPFAIKCLLKTLLDTQDECNCSLNQLHILFSSTAECTQKADAIVHGKNCSVVSNHWLRWRYLDSVLMRINVGFYTKVWYVLQRCPGLCLGDSVLSSDITLTCASPDDRVYLTKVEEWLRVIQRPELRTIMVEALTVLWMVLAQRMPELIFPKMVHIHDLVNYAVYVYINDPKRVNEPTPQSN
eukprot:Ihof_evm1s480 gene=Ihof_evmTU1s480